MNIVDICAARRGWNNRRVFDGRKRFTAAWSPQ